MRILLIFGILLMQNSAVVAQNFLTLRFSGELAEIDIVGTVDITPILELGEPINGLIVLDGDAFGNIDENFPTRITYRNAAVYVEFEVQGLIFRSNHRGIVFISNDDIANGEDSLRIANLRFDPGEGTSSQNTFNNPEVNNQIAENAGFTFSDLTGQALNSLLLEDLLNADKFQMAGFQLNFMTPESGTQGVYLFDLTQPSFEAELLGDLNSDGTVDLLDVSPFVNLLSSGMYSYLADINQDGEFNLLDIGPFVALLN